MRQYRAARRAKTLDRFAVQVRQQRSLHRARALAAAMTDQFGGVDGFARPWKDQFDAAAAAAPGSKFVLDSLRAILRLVEVCGQQRPDYSRWSDEDLEIELRSLLVDVGHDDPYPA